MGCRFNALGRKPDFSVKSRLYVRLVFNHLPQYLRGATIEVAVFDGPLETEDEGFHPRRNQPFRLNLVNLSIC